MTQQQPPLRGPQLADSLCDANIVCLERVQSNTHKHGPGAESPHGRVADEWHTLLGEVVDDARLETNVRVDDQQGAEDRVGDGVQRAGGEGRNGERDEAGGDDPRVMLVPF